MQVGDKIPLQVQYAGYVTEDPVYPLAYVKDADGNDLADSPFELEEEDESGFYVNRDAIMPDSAWVSVDIKFYDDSEHEVLSSVAGGTDYVVYLDTPSSGPSIPPSFNVVAAVESEGCSQSVIQDTIVKGSNRTLAVRLLESPNGAPFDLTGYTLIEFRFRKEDGSVLSIKTNDSGAPVRVISAAAGKLVCILSAVQTALLAARIPAPFSIVITNPIAVTVVNVSTQVAVEDQDV